MLSYNLELISSYVLLGLALFIMFVAVLLTFYTRFGQIRAIKKMFKLLFKSVTSDVKEGPETVLPHKALFTAMSTTIGIAVIAAPVVVMQLGGPGALFYFLLTNIFGSILSFSEVTFAVTYRSYLPDKSILGGPMGYIKEVLPKFFSMWYAVGTFLLLLIWSSVQANTLADALISYHMPEPITGAILATLIIVTLLGGIKRIGNFSEKLVPVMFFLYASSSIYIILCNIERVPTVLDLIFRSAITPRAIIGGSAAGGIFQAMRYGFLRGFNANEAGIGTGSIPHSMAQTKNPTMQGILAMLSLYSHGFLCFLSGLIVLLTGTWDDPTIRFGISAIFKSFAMYFPMYGPLTLTISLLLFGFGTILGNAYNGEQCFKYITNNKFKYFYYSVIVLSILIGSVAPVKRMWIIPDFFLILVAVPNVIAILILAFKRKDLLNI